MFENKLWFCIVMIMEKMPGTIMLKQLVVLLHLSLSDLVTSGGFATMFLTGGSLPYLLFNGPKVLTTTTDKSNLC